MTIYLRFPDQATWLDAASTAGFMSTDDEDNEFLVSYTHDRSVDVVGVLYNDDGVYDVDEDGEDVVVSIPSVMPGWHVNYIGTLPDGWEEYEVTPEKPKRVFA